MKIGDNVIYSADNKCYKIVELFKAKNTDDSEICINLATIENDDKEIHYAYLCDLQKITTQ